MTCLVFQLHGKCIPQTLVGFSLSLDSVSACYSLFS